jgi:beta-glucanase (GH16 family)
MILLNNKLIKMPNILDKQKNLIAVNKFFEKDIKFILKFLVVLLVVLPQWGCSDDEEIQERNWNLVWQDEFEGPAGQLPDANNWNFDLGRGPNGDGWGNFELQTYTNNPENASLDGQGNLKITALNAGGFTSARITTKGKVEQKYGRFEARIKLPYGPGIWPAFWMLGSNIDTAPWPQCGEIDIMEYKGQEPNIIHGSMHGPGFYRDQPITKTFGFVDDRFDFDFYVFAIEWDENSVDYYVNEVLYQRITRDDIPRGGEWVFDQPFYVLLNVAIGGTFVGFPRPQTDFPQSMVVDYVRIYSEAN